MRINPALIGLVGLVVAAGVALVMIVVVPRARAHQQPDWFQSKHLTLAPVIKGLTEPTYVIGAPDGNHLFTLERPGLVRVADSDGKLQPKPFLDLQGQVSLGGEEGLLGFAFDPGYAHNGEVYVSYTAMDWSVQVVRYTVSADDPNVLDPTSAQSILSVPKRSKYHNAGMLLFGPDGYLYVAIGDDEQSDRSQDLGALTGKILRLDVDSGAQPYAIPPSNPFVGSDARGEIWAYGLRNPWRFSFDRATGDLWIGDVHHVDGENGLNWETIQFQPADSPGGLNYGFPMQATFHCADVATCEPAGVTLPVVHYDHNMNCSVTGGYVYHGKSAPGLAGAYIFGDYCTGGVFALRPGAGGGPASILQLAFQPIKISSFGEDNAGELYVADIQGGIIYRVVDGSLP